MASGKSTIGKALSKLIDMPFVDLDDLIEKRHNCSIIELFDTKGELFFRKEERNVLLELLNSKESFILSLGGGTPCYYDNMEKVINNENTLSFYLKTDIKELTDRLHSEKSKRPLVQHLKTKESLTEYIGKHLFERSHYYNKSHYILNNSNTMEVILERIISVLY